MTDVADDNWPCGTCRAVGQTRRRWAAGSGGPKRRTLHSTRRPSVRGTARNRPAGRRMARAFAEPTGCS